jgi:hypothetical protein
MKQLFLFKKDKQSILGTAMALTKSGWEGFFATGATLRGGVVVPFFRMDCGFSVFFLLDSVRRPRPDGSLLCDLASFGESAEMDRDDDRLGLGREIPLPPPLGAAAVLSADARRSIPLCANLSAKEGWGVGSAAGGGGADRRGSLLPGASGAAADLCAGARRSIPLCLSLSAKEV